jgi:hypothetical protein
METIHESLITIHIRLRSRHRFGLSALHEIEA